MLNRTWTHLLGIVLRNRTRSNWCTWMTLEASLWQWSFPIMGLCDLGTGDLLSDQLVFLALTESRATLVAWGGHRGRSPLCVTFTQCHFWVTH